MFESCRVRHFSMISGIALGFVRKEYGKLASVSLPHCIGEA